MEMEMEIEEDERWRWRRLKIWKRRWRRIRGLRVRRWRRK